MPVNEIRSFVKLKRQTAHDIITWY